MPEAVAAQKQKAPAGQDHLSLTDKLLAIQIQLDSLEKDRQNTSEKYDYVSGEQVLNLVRPLMNEYQLLLLPIITEGRLHDGVTKSGTTRYMTELSFIWRWLDCASGESLDIPFYAQGTDLAGEKGVGKALTYGEKYFLMKFFHLPTKDDPDKDERTQGGEKKQRGSQAAKEAAEYHRRAIAQMAAELCGGDADKIRQTYVFFTKNEAAGYAGVDDLAQVSAPALAVFYGKVKKNYEQRLGKAFELKTGEAEAEA